MLIWIRYINLGLITVLMSGCASMTWKNAGDSFVIALKEPMTWINAGGAAVIYAGGWDQEISDDLSENTPIFGSEQDARDASDLTREITAFSMNFSALFVDDSKSDNQVRDKFYRVLGDNLSATFVAHNTGTVQKAIGRERPDGTSNGMPSGHSSRSFSAAYFAHKNYKETYFNPVVNTTLDVVTYTAAYTTALGRVEGKKHYPTDVLMGAAYGTFLSSFIYHFTDNFGLGTDLKMAFSVWDDEAEFMVNYRF